MTFVCLFYSVWERMFPFPSKWRVSRLLRVVCVVCVARIGEDNLGPSLGLFLLKMGGSGRHPNHFLTENPGNEVVTRKRGTRVHRWAWKQRRDSLLFFPAHSAWPSHSSCAHSLFSPSPLTQTPARVKTHEKKRTVQVRDHPCMRPAHQFAWVFNHISPTIVREPCQEERIAKGFTKTKR